MQRKYIAIFPISLCVAFLLSSCDDSKVAQCQRLIKAVTEGSRLVEKNKGSQVTTSLKLAEDLDKVTNDIKNMSFQDPRLQEFQGNFVNIFETLSKEVSKAAKALGSAKTAKASVEGRSKIQKARSDIDASLTAAAKAGKESDTLVKDLDEYCKLPEE